LIYYYIKEFGDKTWIEKFEFDFDKAIKEYWNSLIKGVSEVI
jgi:hypothetical protein